MAEELGTAQIAVRAPLDKIKADLRKIDAMVKAAMAGGFDFDVDANTTAANAALQRVTAAAQGVPDADVQVDVDSAAGQAALARVATTAQAMPDADVDVDVDTGPAMAKIAVMRGAMGSMTANVNAGVTSMGRGFMRLGTQIKGAGIAAAGFAAAFGGVAFMGVKTNAQLETATLQFETLMGSADKAEAHVKSLFDFAKATPFETAPIIEASRIMETFGGDALNTADNLRLFGDAAAATTQPIEEVGFWMSRAYADIQAGRPFGEAAARLSEMGVITPQVRAKLEDLQKTGADGPAVWEELVGSLGRFDGAMLNMSTTWAGITSSLADTAQIGAGRMTEPFFDSLKNLGLEMLAFSETPAWDAIIARGREAFGTIAGLVDQVTAGLQEGGMQGAIDALAEMWDGAVATINWGAIGTGMLTALQTALEGAGALIPQLITVVVTALQGMDWGPVSEGLTYAFIGMLTAVNWTEIAAAAVDLLVTIVPAMIDGFIVGLYRVATERPIDFLMFFVALGFIPAKVLAALGTVLGKIPLLGKFFEWIFGAVAGAAQKLFGPVRNKLGEIGGQAMRGMLGGLDNAWGSVSGWLSGIPGRIGSVFGGAGRWLWDAGRRLIDGFISGITSAFGAVKSTLAKLTSWLPDWKGPPAHDRRLLFDTGQMIMGGFEAGLRSEFGSVKAALGGLTSLMPAMSAPTFSLAGGGGADATMARVSAPVEAGARKAEAGGQVHNHFYGSVMAERDLSRSMAQSQGKRNYVAGRR